MPHVPLQGRESHKDRSSSNTFTILVAAMQRWPVNMHQQLWRNAGQMVPHGLFSLPSMCHACPPSQSYAILAQPLPFFPPPLTTTRPGLLTTDSSSSTWGAITGQQQRRLRQHVPSGHLLNPVRALVCLVHPSFPCPPPFCGAFHSHRPDCNLLASLGKLTTDRSSSSMSRSMQCWPISRQQQPGWPSVCMLTPLSHIWLVHLPSTCRCPLNALAHSGVCCSPHLLLRSPGKLTTDSSSSSTLQAAVQCWPTNRQQQQRLRQCWPSSCVRQSPSINPLANISCALPPLLPPPTHTHRPGNLTTDSSSNSSM